MAYDNKIKQTNKIIVDSFLELLSTKTFEEISVSDISKLAGINRGTFYRHYIDKYDLLEKVEEEFFEVMGKIPRGMMDPKIPTEVIKGNLKDYLRSLFVIVRENSRLLEKLLSDNGDQRFKSRLKEKLSYRIKNSLVLEEKQRPLDLDLAIEFISSADVAVFEYIVDHPEKTQEDIFETFFYLLTNGPMNTLINVGK